MINTNTKIHFEVRTARKGQHFCLENAGTLTTEAPMTKKQLAADLAEDFLNEINASLEPADRYTINEIKVKLS